METQVSILLKYDSTIPGIRFEDRLAESGYLKIEHDSDDAGWKFLNRKTGVLLFPDEVATDLITRLTQSAVTAKELMSMKARR